MTIEGDLTPPTKAAGESVPEIPTPGGAEPASSMLDETNAPADLSVWDTRLAELAAFIKANGHSYVTPRNTGNMDLRGWVVMQRLYARLGTLPADQKEQLLQIGFDLNSCLSIGRPDSDRNHTTGTTNRSPYTGKRGRPAAPTIPWQTNYEQLVRFKHSQGHMRLSSIREANRTLSIWVSKQRSDRRLGKLDPDQIVNLDAISFEWDLRRGAPPRRPVVSPLPSAQV